VIAKAGSLNLQLDGMHERCLLFLSSVSSDSLLLNDETLNNTPVPSSKGSSNGSHREAFSAA
jgi:hypothetical protein